ncbi:hypothetical protein BC941DRAFT_351611 [Chlamydoabsidia padenii]|nr:hypothetical protein BC941DRAFT_351611 [Chlamydoabsidia padenii]
MSLSLSFLGAGVVGLTTAITLLRNGARQVTVVAKDLPGDMNPEFSSVNAGASIISFASVNNKQHQEMDRYTQREFRRLANTEPESGVSYTPGVQYYGIPDAPGEDCHWVRDMFQDYEKIPTKDLPEGIIGGYRYVAFTANVPVYLAFLVKTLISLGGKLERQTFDSLQTVIDQYKDADTLINCTGMGSYYLKDVQDHTLYPVRGQTVIVRAPHIKHQIYKDVCRTERFCTYIIPRGDGTVVLGGTLDRDSTNYESEPELTKAILENCYKLHPYLTHYKGPDAFDILSVDVSFRPGREGGIRMEKETRYRNNGDKVTVAHHYGHSCHGFQSSWGSCHKLLQLLKTRDNLSKL